MPVEVIIVDPLNNKRSKIIDGGAIAVLPPQYNQIFSSTLDVINTVYNIVPPKPDAYFVMNNILITGNKNIGVNDAAVTLYVAKSADEVFTTANAESLTLEVARGGERSLSNMNTRTAEKGAYINGTTDDDDVYVTILGYYTSE